MNQEHTLIVKEVMHFRIAVGELLPFLKIRNQNGVIHMSGPWADALDLVAQRVNFTYTLYHEPHDVWGIKEPNGWTGLLGMISRNEVDLAFGPFTLTYSRWKDFEMSVPMFTDTVEILAPTFEWKMSLFSIFTTFKYSVWIMIFFAVVVLSLTKGYLTSHENHLRSFKQGVFRSFWDIISVLLKKGRIKRPDGYLLTLLSVTWMISAIVLCQIFSAMILSNILIKKVQKIDSIEDLDAFNNIQPVVEFQSSIHGTFKDGDPEVFRSIFRKLQSNPSQNLLSLKNMSTQGMEYVYQGTHALITDTMAIRTFLFQRVNSRLPCNYRLSKQQLWPLYKVFAFGRGFPKKWIEKINNILRSISETNWLQIMMMREFEGFSECLTATTLGAESLKLEHVKGSFIIWFLGCLTSVFAFLVEMCLKERPTPKVKRVYRKVKSSESFLEMAQNKMAKFKAMLVELREKGA